jgi:HAD superfamily phosphatase (TIGR01668 family)
MDMLQPSMCVKSVADLNPELHDDVADKLRGFSGVTWDLDRTLAGHYEEALPREHLAVLIAIKGLGLRQGIISNANRESRDSRVQAIANAMSKAVGDEIFVVTSRMVGGKRKPSRPVFDAMADCMSVSSDRLCHIGDQLLKDVLGANHAGYGGSILVAPYGSGDDWRVKYLQRPVEVVIRPFIGLPLLTRNF